MVGKKSFYLVFFLLIGDTQKRIRRGKRVIWDDSRVKVTDNITARSCLNPLRVAEQEQQELEFDRAGGASSAPNK